MLVSVRNCVTKSVTLAGIESNEIQNSIIATHAVAIDAK